MRSFIKKFDMYKSSEYIPNMTNKDMTFLKLIDKIPDNELKLIILRQMDKINRYENKLLIIVLLLMLLVGGIVGYAMAYSYFYLHGV